MCGRFTQYQAQVRYLERLNWQAPLAFEPSDEPIERYNVAPTTPVQLLHLDADGLRMNAVPWGYAPHWARGQGKRPPAINARQTLSCSTETSDITSALGQLMICKKNIIN